MFRHLHRHDCGWEGGARLEALSQDTGWIALVWMVSHEGASPIHFSVKEKDEASPPGCFLEELVECLPIPDLSESEGFFVFEPAGLASDNGAGLLIHSRFALDEPAST